MKFSEQNINRGFCEYSKPMTKNQLVEFWARTFPESKTDTGIKITDIMTKITLRLNDQDFILSFNKTLNLKIRSFAPGMFQIVYNGTHVFN